MEYTKDIILDLSNGQVGRKKRFSTLKRIWRYISNHKIITSVIIVTIGFIILDMYLITSFMNIISEI